MNKLKKIPITHERYLDIDEGGNVCTYDQITSEKLSIAQTDLILYLILHELKGGA